MARVWVAVVLLCGLVMGEGATASSATIPVLLYHRFGPTAADSMTLPSASLREHLSVLREMGYRVIPLAEAVSALYSEAPLPEKAVVIVTDDAHRSVYGELYPLARQEKVPFTVFAYPSAVSNAAYTMTWEQLREMQASGLVDIQSHTYYHPDFRREKKKLGAEEYAKLVSTQLSRSKARLEKEMGRPVPYLAWPFGIYDEGLIEAAAAAGYAAAFSVDAAPLAKNSPRLALPRYLLQHPFSGADLRRMLQRLSGPAKNS